MAQLPPQLLKIAVLDGIDALPDGFRRIIPPAQLQQLGNGGVGKPAADDSGRYAADSRIGRHVARDDRTGADDGAVADGHAGETYRFKADPDVIADGNVALVVPSLGDAGDRPIPFGGENREGIGRERTHGVVGGIENELCAGGDRAVFAEDQRVMVDRIMVEHAIFDKIPRVVRKIVIHGEVADPDVRLVDDTVQINRPVVSGTGIDFRGVHDGQSGFWFQLVSFQKAECIFDSTSAMASSIFFMAPDCSGAMAKKSVSAAQG
ncbi:hypothetical protein SDC9_104410 [bioreactor metagenome]|uniref:Uncharacterized protein n=1 Tax=bioreactor metagenome TaxID=1076179 RepID=A0A645AXU4_9ZZZZ